MKNKYQNLIIQVLGTKPILYNPDLARALGSVKASIFLSQLLYWHKKGHNPDWVYKTIKEVEKETALSRWEQDIAIKMCKKKKVFEMKIAGVPRKRYFKLNLDNIILLLENF